MTEPDGDQDQVQRPAADLDRLRRRRGGATATSYDVRYRTGGAVTEGNWASCTQVTGEPTPTAIRLAITACGSTA